MLHNLKGTRRFGDMMMMTTTTAIIIVETMYVGMNFRFFNKYTLMLVSETSRNALFLKTITKMHCSIVGFFVSYQYFSKNHHMSEVALTLSEFSHSIHIDFNTTL